MVFHWIVVPSSICVSLFIQNDGYLTRTENEKFSNQTDVKLLHLCWETQLAKELSVNTSNTLYIKLVDKPCRQNTRGRTRRAGNVCNVHMKVRGRPRAAWKILIIVLTVKREQWTAVSRCSPNLKLSLAVAITALICVCLFDCKYCCRRSKRL